MTETAYLVVAAMIDGEAYQSLRDGRDKNPGSMWGMRREFAEAKAKQIVTYLASLTPAKSNGVEKTEGSA